MLCGRYTQHTDSL